MKKMILLTILALFVVSFTVPALGDVQGKKTHTLDPGGGGDPAPPKHCGGGDPEPPKN